MAEGAKRIAILTSGGDSPGMNAAIRSATMVALARGLEVYGVMYGYRGLISDDLKPLHTEDVANIIREGGTILGSARSKEFMEKAGREKARENILKNKLDGLIVIGGNGSLTGARALTNPEEAGADYPLRVIGLPASIDNDIGLTSLAIGVDTAMNTIMEACDKIADTASAHDRTFIVEVMGRDCGYLAMASGIATAASAVLFRESGRSEEEIVDAVVKVIQHARERKGRSKSVLVIKAEGLGIATDVLKAEVDARLKSSSEPVETRVTVLGHIVRGGRPSALDRVLASRLAHVAVRGILAGQTRKMAAWGAIEAKNVTAERDKVDPQCWLVDLEDVLAETARLLDGSSPTTQRRAKMFEEVSAILAL